MLTSPQTAQTAPSPAPVVFHYSIRLRPAAWCELRKITNTESDQALAVALGINRSNVYRVMTGDAEPSPKFIAHTLAAFRFASFDRLFEPYRKAT